MARLILFFVLLIICYYVLHFIFRNLPFQRKMKNRGDEPEELVQDPYCQMYIPKQSAVRKKIDGHMFYFCNQECLKNYLHKMKKYS